MVEWSQSYTDRFGNEWSITTEQKRGKPRRVVFTCGEFQLVAFQEEAASDGDLSAARLKELFCEAERVLEHDEEKWYVGFRQRMGRGGRVQAGIHTRFRSESGEIRYAKTMLHFRHMSADALREQLGAAVRAAS
ncbi:MAG: hypothetical protein JSW71_09180 [Gemmatimonadota bacterium]|nr:MAG: hypothetical protein JSW71_09180 [Gemmatimonadota bacterium]